VRRKRGCCKRENAGKWERFKARGTSHVNGFVDGLSGPDRSTQMLPSGFHSATDIPGVGTVDWKYRHADISSWLV